jgi:hypothetical protein
MSTNSTVSFAELPEAGEVKSGDFFVIEDVNLTKKIDFKNIIFGLENVTFASTLSTQSTDIATLSSDVISLSGQVYQEVDNLTSLLNTTVQSATASFVNILYPIGSVMYTTTNTNPTTLISNTTWEQVSQGLFLAGVGAGVDKNGNGFTVGPENAAGNYNAGEYRHKLIVSELPPHSHTFSIRLNVSTSSNANVNSYQNGPQASPGMRLDTATNYNTDPAGNSTFHNNIPPFYGVYVWKRVS